MKIQSIIAASTMVAVLAILVGCSSTPAVPQSAMQVQPKLVGASAPEVPLTTADGDTVTVPELAREKPVVLVFYRGGWCPYCNVHLKELARIQGDLQQLGYQVVAVSPDRPAKLKDTATQQKLGYTLLSDQTMAFARAMGVAFQVDDATLKKYKTYDIDLEAWSGKDHHWLPVPSVFLVNGDGLIAYNYVNPDYTFRLSSEVLLAAAKAAQAE